MRLDEWVTLSAHRASRFPSGFPRLPRPARAVDWAMLLRIGFVGIVRPLFKGDSPGAASRSLKQLRALGEELGFEVVTPEVTGNEAHAATGRAIPGFAVSNLAAAEQAARQLAAQDLDLLLIQHTTFATGELLVPLLHAAERVGVWALPEAAGNGGEGGPLPLNALCGLNMTLSLLEHPKVAKREPVKWFYGEAESVWFRERLVPTLLALRGLRALGSARVLQIGGTAPGFYGLEETPVLPGVRVDAAELSELFARIAAVPEAEAEALARDWAAAEAHDLSRVQLARAARIELALWRWAEEGGYQALAVRCWPELPERCGSMACAAMGNVSSRIPAACEGDVMGALSMLVLAGMSGESAILMDLSDLAGEALQFWHCGNAPREWAAGGHSRLTAHFNRDGVGAVRDMMLRPGPVSGFRLLDGALSALIFSGRFGTLERAGFDGVRGWLADLRWNGVPLEPRAFVANVLDRRLPHHFAFGALELSAGLAELCAWLGARVLAAEPPRATL